VTWQPPAEIILADTGAEVTLLGPDFPHRAPAPVGAQRPPGINPSLPLCSVADLYFILFYLGEKKVGRTVVAMPIVRLLQEAALPPDRIQAITSAYAQTCKALLLTDRDDPLTLLVAKKVIEIAQGGEQEPEAIALRALNELLGADLADRINIT
jgi:hypothetical protein